MSRLCSRAASGTALAANRTAFAYRLEHEDGTPADPPTLRTAVPTWSPGDTIPLGKDASLVAIRDEEGDQPLLLVVDDLPGSAASAAG